MSFVETVKRSNFFIKLTHWEYWPFGIVQFPVILYYGWLSLRARSFFFFSASNPGIPMGGMFGESKYDILSKVPRTYTPTTIFIPASSTKEEVLSRLKEGDLEFPVIFKPDLGERGFMVKRIQSAADVEAYLQQMKFDFIAQELVNLPLEFGVFYTRFPQEAHGRVTSVVKKEMLTVTGDGSSTLQQLILAKDRAKLQWETLKNTYRDRLTEVLKAGQTLELVSIGNHCLGTKFLDGTSLISPELSASFDRISQQIDGFYFGRFDLRCASEEDLAAGRVKVMELNGCGAEPAHIYHPGYSLRKALRVLFTHWRNIFIIARENSRRGVPYTSWKEGASYYRKFKAATQAK